LAALLKMLIMKLRSFTVARVGGLFEMTTGLTRRLAFLSSVLASMFVLTALSATTQARAETPAAFMQRAANDLMAAQRTGTPTAFAAALRRYSDVPSIGMGALGNYAVSLGKSDRPLYYNGMVNFIARYAVKESAKYQIVKANILGQSDEDAQGASVETRVYLAGGESYDVRWKLVRSGQSFKIRDAQVLGFWMTPFLATLFQNYIAENGGSSKALIMALNR
jgi:phospholipid transport system substrate-binding protein